MRTQTTSVTISAGSLVALSQAGIEGAAYVGLHVPYLINSCNLFLQAAHDTTSASFARVQHPTSSGDWTMAVESLGRAVDITALVAGFNYVKPEFSSVQSADRAFTLTTKF